MKHGMLLELHLTHSYYTDGRCADFTLEPSQETARLLASHRCPMTTSASGLRVLTALDDVTGQPFLPLPANTPLRFELRLQNQDFALFTDLADPVWQRGAQSSTPLFTNAGLGSGVTALKLVAGDTARTPDLFAMVELHLDGPAGTAYTVPFAAKQQRWAYYCVTTVAQSGGELAIVDAAPAGTTDVLLFSAANQTALDQNPDAADPIAVQLASRYPGLRCIRMLSDHAVACRQEPRKYLELRQGSDRLCGPLPNPALRHGSRIAASDPQDVLFQIVKYQVDPFTNP